METWKPVESQALDAKQVTTLDGPRTQFTRFEGPNTILLLVFGP